MSNLPLRSSGALFFPLLYATQPNAQVEPRCVSLWSNIILGSNNLKGLTGRKQRLSSTESSQVFHPCYTRCSIRKAGWKRRFPWVSSVTCINGGITGQKNTHTKRLSCIRRLSLWSSVIRETIDSLFWRVKRKEGWNIYFIKLLG